MQTDHIVQLIDAQIAQLQKARAALAGIENTSQSRPNGQTAGRPKGSGKKAAEVNAPAPKKAAKRTMSAEGKARIAAAQKKRWAAQKKAEEPAARKYAVRPKPAKKKAAPAETIPSETQATTATTAADAQPNA